MSDNENEYKSPVYNVKASTSRKSSSKMIIIPMW